MRKSTAVIATTALAVGIYGGAIAYKPTVTVSPVESAPPPTAVVIDEQAVLSALKAEGQLVGLTGDVSKTVTVKNDAWYGDKTYELAATGTFKLGVNTNDIEITTHGNTVKVRFPQPELLTIDMPFDKATLTKDVGLLRKDIDESHWQALYAKARTSAVEDIERDRQAFEKAGQSVERVIERLVESVDGVEDVDFVE